jgi:hypothetical protein
MLVPYPTNENASYNSNISLNKNKNVHAYFGLFGNTFMFGRTTFSFFFFTIIANFFLQGINIAQISSVLVL